LTEALLGATVSQAPPSWREKGAQMYLFSRRRHINTAKAREAMATAVEACPRVSQVTGWDVRVWATVHSPDITGLLWTTSFEHLEELAAGFDKLVVDEGWNDWLAQHDAEFVGPIDDNLLQVLHGAPGEQAPEYVQAVRAVCANGMLSRGIELGIELAQTAERITGVPVMFTSRVTGEYGGVAWISGAPDLATFETESAALAADASWAELLDRAGPAYQPGADTFLLRRLA
jgi:hypothetical protein